MPLEAHDLLLRHERRALRRYGRRDRGAGGLDRLGDPATRDPEWCRQALAYVVEIDGWAPEIDWSPQTPSSIRCVEVRNAEWLAQAAEHAATVARILHTPHGEVTVVLGDPVADPGSTPVKDSELRAASRELSAP